MQCPKCQAEVLEWHFYCQNCQTQIQGYKPGVEKPSRGRFERAGVRMLNAMVWMLTIAVLVLTGRLVQWGELFAAIRGDTDISVIPKPDTTVNRASHSKSVSGRPDYKASAA